MGRRQYAHLSLTCHRGVNQQAEIADQNECADALNVWAPTGRVEQRPGYEGVYSFISAGEGPGTATTSQLYASETTGGTVVVAAEDGTNLVLDSWAVNAFWYLGLGDIEGTFSLSDGGTRDVLGVNVKVDSKPNANSTAYKAEYWNGTEWKFLVVHEKTGGAAGRPDVHLGNSSLALLHWVKPGDWAQSTLTVTSGGATHTKYWIRFTLQDNAMDGEVELDNAAATSHRVSKRENAIRGYFVGEFPTLKRYVYIANIAGSTTYYQAHDNSFQDKDDSSTSSGLVDESIATHAVVPQFMEGFTAYGGEVMRYQAAEDWAVVTGGGAHIAQVEDKDFAVGPNAPYDPAYVDMESAFPRGRYISFFKNRLWLSGNDEEPYTVRWSAAAPYHKVWATLSAEPLMEDDNSPITGMAPLGDHMIVFKQDSIWQMVATGENSSTQVEHYSPIRVVAGVGCVSHSSIQKVKGMLVFLAEDGVYAFDGTPNITKISDRVQESIDSIAPGRRGFAASVHWRTKNCYLLSAAMGGSFENNKTLVWDYKNNAWWIWDVPATLWVKEEDKYDDETVYFLNAKSCKFLLGVGNHDHGSTISSYILTQRLGDLENIRRTTRQVEVTSDNLTNSLTVAVRTNDDEANESSGTLTLTDDGEAKYTETLLYAVDKAYVPPRNRARRLSFRKQGDWVQVKVSHAVKNTPMSIRSVDIGFSGEARR